MPLGDSGGVIWTSDYRIKGVETMNRVAHRNRECRKEVEHSTLGTQTLLEVVLDLFLLPLQTDFLPCPRRMTYMDDTHGLSCPLVLFGFN